jgi:nucleotide-binding universal stress UspA family protein
MPRPVLLVRPREGKPDLGREPRLKSILVPLDGTPLAEQVLEPAVALGKLFDAEFTLVRVDKPVVRPRYLPDGGTALGLTHSVLEQVQDLQRRSREESQKYLDGVAARLAARGFRVHTRVVIDEQPAPGILLEAEARRADLVAIETHGRRGLSRLVLGSVADKVVRGGAVPVLLHRPAQ